MAKGGDLVLSDPGTADYDKRTPLHLASAEGFLDIVQWLLSHNVDPNPIDRFKRTPLEVNDGEPAAAQMFALGNIMALSLSLFINGLLLLIFFCFAHLGGGSI